jgi:hypothetical protein
MRTLIIIIINLSVLSLYSQELLYLGWPHSSINFEDTSEYKYVSNDTNKVWHIGKPQKDILFLPSNHLYLGKYAIVTDAIDCYPDSIHASFQFKLTLGEADEYEISFSHKYDFEENSDGGIIETSFDLGQTWNNILSDPKTQDRITYLNNFYSLTDTISSNNNQPGFTGLQVNITRVIISFLADEDIRGDTMLLRFTITSDSIDTQNEGWMLDYFRFGGIMTYNIESNFSDVKIQIYPNPIDNLLFINNENNINDIKQIHIINSAGIIIMSNNVDRKKHFMIDLSRLTSGIYYIRFDMTNNEFITKVFIKK